MARGLFSVNALLLVVACSPKAPRDFAPDPGLVAQIRQIRIITQEPGACPGERIHTDYEAILTDGSRVPFARAYDKTHPPRLHVQFLERQSPDAAARRDGDWEADDNPLETASSGFRLTATLHANSTITSTVVLPPVYDCMPHEYAFGGASGIAGGNGGYGPDITVRLEVQHSPFYEKLYVAEVLVEGMRARYVLGDASATGPADWLLVESRGGDGGAGQAGINGIDGTMGFPGCPGQAGGQGTDGTDGGAGGDGGNGGHITIIVPPDQTSMAKLVRSASWGGAGGSGGAGGTGGRGGSGGVGLVDANNQPCSSGADGSPGHNGLQGRSGFPGSPGPRTTASAATKEPADWMR